MRVEASPRSMELPDELPAGRQYISFSAPTVYIETGMRETLQIASNGRRLGSVVATLFILTACGPSSSRYLANRDEKVYLRVPNSWHDVQLSDAVLDHFTQVTSEAKVISKSVVSPQDGAVSQVDLDGQSPIATMTVYETGAGVFNQQLSPSLARKVGWVAFDPLIPPDEARDLAEVVTFDPNPSNAKTNISGSRVVYRYRSEPTTDWRLMVSFSTFFDPSASRLYALEVVCSTTCYEQSAGEIDKIVNSWRIG